MKDTVAMPISILLADDHTLLGESLELFLNAEGDFAVTRAETLEQALGKIARHGTFDVVLLDLDMPGMGGLQGLEKAVAANAQGKVVLFSGQARHDAALRAIELGASGFIPKTLSPKSLATAVRFVVAGEIYFPTAMNFAKRDERSSDVQLSQREYQVLRGICDGATNKDIAQELQLTEVTVKMYVRSVCTKLKANNRTQAAIIALSSGMI